MGLFTFLSVQLHLTIYLFLLNIDSEKNSLLNNMFNTINASPNSTYYKIKKSYNKSFHDNGI